ncbi:MAG TPA: YciI family protein [Gemmata sp.]|nr:YciI family protein [Gemmata sp.]
MRVMVHVMSDAQSETDCHPTEQLLSDMAKFNDELFRAGILLAGGALKPSAQGVRVRLAGTSKNVIDGPFAETKELVGGFWLWRVKSMEEAIAIVKRVPFPPGMEKTIEIRPVLEAEDWGGEFAPALRAQEERNRAEAEKRK